MAELLKIEVTKQELDKGIIPTNHVLMLMDYVSEGAKTKSGITYGVLTDLVYADSDNLDDDTSHAADMAEVSGVVVKCPQKLFFDPDDDKSMNWETDMELEIGDRVWTNPIETLNAVSLVCEGRVYKIIPYHEIYVAKRHHEQATYIIEDKFRAGFDPWDEIIVLNGFVLCRQKNKESLSNLDVTSEDKTYQDRGIVAYVGKPNKRYKTGDHMDFVDLKIGDEVMWDYKYKAFLLERQKYASRFDEDNLYFVVPRRRIVAVLNRGV